jgi:hypothetical protein
MRRIVFALLALTAACGAAPSAETASAPAQPAPLGAYKAESSTARSITGDVSIERGGLVFANGVVLYTRTLEPRQGGDLIAKGGDTYAASALGPSSLVVELRRVTEQTTRGGAVGLCGATRPDYIALVHDVRATTLTLLVFAGAEPPGRDATQSRLCASFAYVAPDGARTRQGVLL